MKDQQNLGARALRAIAELWQSDGPRSRWRDDGFDWWPGDFKVSVSALRRLDEFGPETWQISVRTDFLNDVPINHPDVAERVGLLSKLSSTYALMYPPPQVWEQHGTPRSLPHLSFSNTVYVTSENIDWLPVFLGQMAIMQPINAQLQSTTTAPLFPGSSPAMSRPDALANAGLDGMLEVAAQVYAPAGSEPNRWFGTDEFVALAEGWNKSEFCHAAGSEHDLSLETSFGGGAALIRLWTDQSSIQLGNGLLTTLQIPCFADPKTIAEQCAALNFVETLWTDVPQFGRWHPQSVGNGQECLAFAVFIPNALYGPGIASQAVYWMLQRARKLRQERWPDIPDKPIREIIAESTAGHRNLN
jgi:hypothetical protein